MYLFTKNKQITEQHTHLKNTVQQLRNQVFTELDEHREAINADTQEIGFQASRIDELENKIDNLAKRLDSLSATLQQSHQQTTPLTIQEQQVFLALYTDGNGLHLRDISMRSGVSLRALPSVIESMIYKNIPIQQEFCNGEIIVSLDGQFKELHAKENVITISQYAVHATHERQHITLDRFDN